MPKRAVCSLCDERPRTKMASFYWAWYWPSGDRRSYKQLLDPVCAMPTLSKVRRAIDEPQTCAGCRTVITGEPEQWLYLTLYVPGRDRLDVDLPYHVACFEKDADAYTAGAQRLLDRPLQAGGPPPGEQQADPWTSWDQARLAST